MTKYRLLIFLLALSAAPYVQAADTELVVQAGVERFRWREFDEFGTRLLEEKGKRGNIGVAWDNFRRDTSGVLYGANGRIYGGTVNYDGGVCNLQTGSCEPASSDTSYFGGNIEGEGGYRLGSRLAFDLLGGIGLDSWRRSLGDTQTASGATQESGYDESYTILYAKFSPGIFHDLGTWRYRFNLGVKYPFFIDEYVNLEDGLNLSPKGRASGFARFQADLGNSRRFNLGFAIYYDSYRFAESDPEPLKRNGRQVVINNRLISLLQPESHMDVRGVQIRLSIF